MDTQNEKNKIFLPHHEQQSLCTTRLPYRQGRKLTAVKVYSITRESNHLLIFGVPSLNLRQEIKSQFMKFGKLVQFNITKEHASETFTETYHAQYDRIQSARIAKRMLDTKNFYGGSLHVCYAPELETIDETQQKLVQRQKDVIFRLNNLQKDENLCNQTPLPSKTATSEPKRLNMGLINTISIGNDVRELSIKKKKTSDKKYEPCFIENKVKRISQQKKDIDEVNNDTVCNIAISKAAIKYTDPVAHEGGGNRTCDSHVEVIDCTQVDSELITNINEHLNYNNFGNEVIKKVLEKPVNRIQFHINKKT